MTSAASLILPPLPANLSISPADPAAPPLKSGIDRANFDTSIKPGQDFFQYVNGNWIKSNPIPAEYSRWGAFPQLRDNNLVALGRILNALLEQSAPLEGNAKKLSAFYMTAMDEAKLEQQGAAPLAAELEKIAAVKTPQELTALVAHFHAAGLPALFALSVVPDEKKSDRYAVHRRQGGLGLPERNYYFDDTDDAKRIRAQYREHVAKMLALLGNAPDAASAGADAVLRIETRLAQASRTPTQLRDREAQYNKNTLVQLKSLSSEIDWPAYLPTAGVADADTVDAVIVGQPEFLARVN